MKNGLFSFLRIIFVVLGIGPEGGEALSSHHIWMFILSDSMSVRTYVYTLPPDAALRMDGQAGGTKVQM
jgi:hypothetical protein